MKYLIDLQELRGISILFVILFHYSIVKEGYYGVDIFILISGHLIYNQYNKSLSIISFYINRVKRIIILSYFMQFLVVSYYSIYYKNDFIHISEEYKFALLLLSNIYYIYSEVDYFLSTTKKYFLHYWYISMDFHFYLLYPLIHKTNSFCIIIFYIIYLYINIKYREISYFVVISRLYEYEVGVLSLLHRRFNNKNVKIITIILLIAYILVAHGNCYIDNLIIIIITFFYLINNTSCFALHVIEYIGNISYILYLIHYPLVLSHKSIFVLILFSPIYFSLQSIEYRINKYLNTINIIYSLCFIIWYYILCRNYLNKLLKSKIFTTNLPSASLNSNCCDSFSYTNNDILIVGDSHAYRYLINVIMLTCGNNYNIYWKYVYIYWIAENRTILLYNIINYVHLIISINLMTSKILGNHFDYKNLDSYYNYLKSRSMNLIVYLPTPTFSYSMDCYTQLNKKIAIKEFNISSLHLSLHARHNKHIYIKDLSKYYCNNKTCNLIYENSCIYEDTNHLNPLFLRKIAQHEINDIKIYFPLIKKRTILCNSFIIYNNKIPYNWYFLRNKCIKSYFSQADLKK